MDYGRADGSDVSRETAGAVDQQTPANRLDRWKRRLLDLSLRNRLLNFRPTRTTLPVLCPTLRELYGALSDGSSFGVCSLSLEGDNDSPCDWETHDALTGGNPHVELVRAELADRRLCARVEEDQLSRRLLEIYRQTRVTVEETGVSTLFMALGFLTWREPGPATTPRKAPILLVPLQIERRSVQEGVVLRLADEDPVTNITLLELMRHDHGIHVQGIDPLPEKEGGVDVVGVMQQFRQAVLGVDGWEVTEQACIGLFSFVKFLMWRDLEVRSDELRRSPVVRHLLDTPSEPYPDSGGWPAEERLDDDYRPEQVHCVLSADSSQLAAILAGATGTRSFVLHGPPGTGKSQTIANLVAQALAHGKTVLFVSEKAAALQVVQRRLEDCGLAPFCLELHSHKSNKRAVLEQLRQALGFAARSPSVEWQQTAEHVGASRQRLNAYVRAMHRQQSTGETMHEVLSRLIGLGSAPEVRLKWPRVSLSAEQLASLRAIVHELAAAALDVGHPAAHPWAPVSRSNWSIVWEQQVIRALRECDDAVAALTEAADRVARQLGLDAADWSVADHRRLCRLAKVLAGARSVPPALFETPDWPAMSAELEKLVAHGRSRDDLREMVQERYEQSALDLDLDELASRLARAARTWLLPRVLLCRSVRQMLWATRRPGPEAARGPLAEDVEALRSLRDANSRVAALQEELRRALPAGRAEDWDWLTAVREKAEAVHLRIAGFCAGDVELAGSLYRTVANWLAAGSLEPGSAVERDLTAYRTAANRLTSALNALLDQLGVSSAIWGDETSPGFLHTVQSLVRTWLESASDLRGWCHWLRASEAAVAAGLQGLVAAYEKARLSAEQIGDAFERSYAQWFVNMVIDSDPALRDFSGADFSRLITEFQRADEAYVTLTRQVVQAKVAERMPHRSEQSNANSEMGILRRELMKQRGHMAVRRLLERIPNLLTRLKPCLLMSPLSVAQYLDPSFPPFDIVVFDEASQIPVWDAIGALARGRQAVIVGDPKQLPPTSFFEHADEDDPLDSNGIEDLESILDECLAARLPERHLRWHYRSRHDSLIAFSNQQYYRNGLLTFPSPERRSAVHLTVVPGVYDRAGSRTNRVEAEAVVHEIVRRLSNPESSGQSIGVVTFNLSQQRLIEDLLEEVRRAHPELEGFFGADCSEPVFVKNLENVQGDERDVILFSIGYGPDAGGRVSLNFGPLNRDGGQRRLNVAITRARQEVRVFSSLRADQIDLTRTKAPGVAELKWFLDYAERGPVALRERAEAGSTGEYESPFEEAVCQALRDRGYEVHPQVGCSGYRIDLGVVDSRRPGRYLLGVECDGANYHRAKTARDRDRLREEVLRELGWRLVRVWSTDWWRDPARELQRIEAAIQQAQSADTEPSPAPPAPGPAVPHGRGQMPPPAECAPERATCSVATHGNGAPYVAVEYGPLLGDLHAFYGTAAEWQISRRLEDVIATEGPVSVELALRRVAECWGISRIGSRVRERIERMLLGAPVRTTVFGGRWFLWPADADPAQYRTWRYPGEDPRTRRDIQDITPEELANAARDVLAREISLPRDELVAETGRLFGAQRVTTKMQTWLAIGIDLLLASQDARAEEGRVILRQRT